MAALLFSAENIKQINQKKKEKKPGYCPWGQELDLVHQVSGSNFLLAVSRRGC